MKKLLITFFLTLSFTIYFAQTTRRYNVHEQPENFRKILKDKIDLPTDVFYNQDKINEINRYELPKWRVSFSDYINFSKYSGSLKLTYYVLIGIDGQEKAFYVESDSVNYKNDFTDFLNYAKPNWKTLEINGKKSEYLFIETFNIVIR